MSVHTICIFTQSPLSKAPRVVKEANVYAREGYDVTVYGLWYDKNLLEKDKTLLDPAVQYKAGINLMDCNSLRAKKIRLLRKLSRDMVKWFRVESIGALGYDFTTYLSRIESEDADLYIGHEEMSMALAEQLIKKGKKVAFDFEDWHSRDLLPKDRVYRPLKLLERLEKELLNEANYTYTTSKAMASAMTNYYGSKMPAVIYNSFPKSERHHSIADGKDREDCLMPSLYWFSQVISSGRGLELLLDALKLTKAPCQLHLRGEVSDVYKKFLEVNIPNHVKLFIHKTVPYHELLPRIMEHDLGIAFEENHPENKNLTISNKIFHYLQAGIAVLATVTEGQREVAKVAPKAISITESKPELMAAKIDEILSNPSLLAKMKSASWHAGATDFTFEIESDKLKTFIQEL